MLGFEATTTLDEMLDEVIPWIEQAIEARHDLSGLARDERTHPPRPSAESRCRRALSPRGSTGTSGSSATSGRFSGGARRTLPWYDQLLAPHNEHWSTAPYLIYRLLEAVFGIRSYWPYFLPAILLHLLVVHLVWWVML